MRPKGRGPEGRIITPIGWIIPNEPEGWGIIITFLYIKQPNLAIEFAELVFKFPALFEDSLARRIMGLIGPREIITPQPKDSCVLLAPREC